MKNKIPHNQPLILFHPQLDQIYVQSQHCHLFCCSFFIKYNQVRSISIYFATLFYLFPYILQIFYLHICHQFIPLYKAPEICLFPENYLQFNFIILFIFIVICLLFAIAYCYGNLRCFCLVLSKIVRKKMMNCEYFYTIFIWRERRGYILQNFIFSKTFLLKWHFLS